MKNCIFSLLAALIFSIGFVEANIVEIDDIGVIEKKIDKDTLVLFNIAEVLMDTEISLGTQAWRKYVRARVDAKTHDELTLFVFLNVPPKTPQDSTAELIAKLQVEGNPVFAFTSRGMNEWYSTQILDVDLLTEERLYEINIDFSKTRLPDQLANIEDVFSDHYHAGIIYTSNSVDKGQLLKALFDKTGYRPLKVVFVDDKIDSLKSVESIMKDVGIEFWGFAYNRTAKEHADFDPMIAHIQLDMLITQGKVLSDEEAVQIKIECYTGVDPDEYFMEIVNKWIKNEKIPRSKL